MKKGLQIFFILIFSLSCSIITHAQESHTAISLAPKKFKKYISPGAAFSYSVINNRLEVRGQYKPGINFNLNFNTKPWFYWSTEYTYFFPHNSSPGLGNIHAWNTEVNGNFQMAMAGSDLMFRTVFGLSYMKWTGTYVGPDLNDNPTWYIGKIIKQDWVAGNLGVGFCHKIGNHFYGNVDFRMRFATEKKDLISISDTAFLIGLKWQPNFSKGNDRNDSKHGSKGNPNNRNAFRYKWLKKRT